MSLQSLPFPPVYLVLGLFALAGLAVVAYSAREFWVAWRLHRTEPTPVADVPNRTGTVEVEGRARIAEGTVTTPFTGTESLACEWRVEEERHDDDGSDWVEIASGVQKVPFRVEDETGSVLVYPAGADFRLSQDARIDVDGGERPPDPIQRFIDAEDSVDDENTDVEFAGVRLVTGDDRRYFERRLDPDEQVYVYGTVRYDPSVSERAGEVNAVLEPGGLFVVADTDGRGVTRRVVRDALVPLFVGLFFVAVAVFFGVVVVP
ncbi:GIDE domain-containing protein [Halomarina oriensis]|uniref:RING-type E3 ubiquitin transferase n=1 Tax=Halomarina oriensis TaxID=671145 RepID=A0A6B0GR44_9EURY|nr:GIDE domain-containing protein [Halomarina oriensis]MWG34128.1 hypothetical protein [Halomarina oriensis]